jgi:hypothetical protein
MNVREREKHGKSAFARWAQARRRAALARPRWASLAGSILAGVVVGTWLWSGGSGNSLAADVISHIEDEAAARVAGDPAPADVISRVLEQGVIRLQPDAGEVLYASHCRFRGRSVPHLLIRTEAGPVSVLLLRHEPVDTPVNFTGSGFWGRIEPAGPGSLALVSSSGANLERVAADLTAAIDWH